MLQGAWCVRPAVGATVMSVDESSVKDMPGVREGRGKKNFVGVVAEKPWQAMQAAQKLKVTWTAGTGSAGQPEFYEWLKQAADARHDDGGFEGYRANDGGRGAQW